MTTTLAQDSQHVVMQTPAPVVAASDMSPFTCGDFSANMCLGQSASVNNVLPYHSGIHGETTSNRYQSDPKYQELQNYVTLVPTIWAYSQIFLLDKYYIKNTVNLLNTFPYTIDNIFFKRLITVWSARKKFPNVSPKKKSVQTTLTSEGRGGC